MARFLFAKACILAAATFLCQDVDATLDLFLKYNDPTKDQYLPICKPDACMSPTYSTFGLAKLNSTEGEPYRLECDIASGHLPTGLEVPMVYEGDFDLCQTFDEAHYCNIITILGIPLEIPKGQAAMNALEESVMQHGKGVFPLGPFILGQCVNKQCGADLLRQSFYAQLKELAKVVLKKVNTTSSMQALGLINLAWPTVVEVLDKIVFVQCVDPPKPIYESGAFGIVMTIVVLAATCITCTSIHMFSGGRHKEKWVNVFSAKNNFERLCSPVESNFNVFNGVRFISIIWIVAGHTMLFKEALSVNFTESDKLANSFGIAWIYTGTRSVDTFFFMSGFLCTWSLIPQLRKSPLTPFLYMKMAFARYVRLTPLYAVLLFFYWKVFPYMGEGPYTNLAFNVYNKQDESCGKYWWTNLLYINNLVPWNQAGQHGCMGWSWYLANDMQFFLLTPFVVYFYVCGLKCKSWLVRAIAAYLPCLILVIVQIALTAYTMFEFNLNGNNSQKNYWGHVYATPWTRWTPYFVGCALAFLHHSRTEAARLNGTPESWRRWGSCSTKLVHIGFVLNVLMMFVYNSAVYLDYRCTDTETNCNAYFSLIAYGFVRFQNWSMDSGVWYTSFVFLAWSVNFGYMMYALFCGYDLFRVKWILEAKIFTPVARLTYGVYLIHLIIIYIVSFRVVRLQTFTTMQAIIDILGITAISYLFSLFAFLIVEKPAMNLLAIVMGVNRGKTTPKRASGESSDEESAGLLGKDPQVNDDVKVFVLQPEESSGDLNSKERVN